MSKRGYHATWGAKGFVDPRSRLRKVAIALEPAQLEAVNKRARRKGTSFAAEARALIARGLEVDPVRPEAAE